MPTRKGREQEGDAHEQNQQKKNEDAGDDGKRCENGKEAPAVVFRLRRECGVFEQKNKFAHVLCVKLCGDIFRFFLALLFCCLHSSMCMAVCCTCACLCWCCLLLPRCKRSHIASDRINLFFPPPP